MDVKVMQNHQAKATDSEKEHSKTWIAMQKYKGTVTVYDQSLFY